MNEDSQSLAQAVALRNALGALLEGYLDAKITKFGKATPMWAAMERAQSALTELTKDHPHIAVKGSVGQGNWATVPWLALMDDRLTETTQQGTYLVYLFRADMSGVYATLNQGVTQLKKSLGWTAAKKRLIEVAQGLQVRFGERLRPGFTCGEGIDLRATGLGGEYEASTVAWRLYERGNLPSPAELVEDLRRLLAVYDELASKTEGPMPADDAVPPDGIATRPLAVALRERGFTFEPWQVAAFVHALRTKPFVILAGISGTGKSKLPVLVGELTGAKVHLVPVRPDWTDSADLIGYTNLQGTFVPGRLLEIAKAAIQGPEIQHLVVLDEMNLARVEQYFAEVLSLIEDRVWSEAGPRSRAALAPSASDEWREVYLPANLAIVGTVNMDETTHGFSRKVLDRAFTLEMSSVDLSDWRARERSETGEVRWPLNGWRPRGLRPSELDALTERDIERVDQVIEVLTDVNEVLTIAQLQVGYRVRDEVALFLLHADADKEGFAAADPMDLALNMKVLPRIQGGSGAVREILQRLLLWSAGKFAREAKPTQRMERMAGLVDPDEVERVLTQWRGAGRRDALDGARYPRTAARLCLMWERLQTDGFTSYWL
ncbi:MAG TPA: DUF3578 domain-containing protein [Myxococcota bacterium]|nr:DUF3578 domain-containing protein [Myxococcota bacterium]